MIVVRVDESVDDLVAAEMDEESEVNIVITL